MTLWTLIRRSLRFHARAHFGALLGAAVGSAVLVGALVVGDSVRGSLRERALERLAGADVAINSGDRFFESSLLDRTWSKATNAYLTGMQLMYGTPGQWPGSVALRLPATVNRQDVGARANQVSLYGVDNRFFDDVWLQGGVTRRLDASMFRQLGGATNELWAGVSLRPGTVWLNQALARHLSVKAGDTLVFRIHKPSALSRDAVITPQDDQAIALRLEVAGVAPDELGNFSLHAEQTVDLNAFVSISELGTAAGLADKANMLIAGGVQRMKKPTSYNRFMWWIGESRLFRWPLQSMDLDQVFSIFVSANGEQHIAAIEPHLKASWTLADAELATRTLAPSPSQAGGEAPPAMVELHTRRIFLDPPVVAAALGTGAGSKGDPPVPSGNLPDETGEKPRTETGASNSERASSPIPRGESPVLPRPETAALQTSTNAIGVLTYLVNLIRAGERATPYSMVTATGAPWVPADMADDEILVNEWLAEDLQVRAGDRVELSYYLADSGSQLTERTNTFRVRSVVPIRGLYADRTLMPEFPGLAKAESTHDWDAGFPLTHKIRDQDEAYWKKFRGTPKAYVTLAAGQRMWSNRFGNLTAIRWFVPTNTPPETFRAGVESNVRDRLDPADVGLKLEPVRDRALAGADQGQDFGQLFLGFSFFLIGAALLLMALLYQFGVEQRTPEIGTLLALGFRPKQVRRLLLAEGVVLSALGALLGVAGGIAYAKGMLWGLSTIWSSAVGASALRYHAEPGTLALGAAASTTVATLVIWLALRQQARQPARVLLAEGGIGDGGGNQDGGVRSSGSAQAQKRAELELRAPSAPSGTSAKNWSLTVALASTAAALGLVGFAFAKGQTANAGLFFGAGALLLIGGLAFASACLRRLIGHAAAALPSLGELALRNAARRRRRSLAVIALLACGSFLITSIGAFRLDADKDAASRKSGTGGFRYIGESSLPIVQDLNTSVGREHFALDDKALGGVNFVPMRVREGDDASCLNLNRAQRPRLLGVRPEALAERGAFTFAKAMRSQGSAGASPSRDWMLLNSLQADGAVPAIGDAASIQWALGKKVGDTLDYTDERGRAFKVRIVGAVANSILQGSLLIAEEEFVRRFPSESGYRMFLIDAPSNDTLPAALSRALQDVGFELTPATTRLAAFNAVQNTYLNTFQVLGGLGLLLGSVGLGVVVLRNVLERRSELAVLLAVGFRQGAVRRLVVSEHGALLLIGLGVGVAAALVAVLPSLLAPRGEFPVVSLALTLGAVLVNGAIWTWVAAVLALRGKLVDSLRSE